MVAPVPSPLLLLLITAGLAPVSSCSVRRHILPASAASIQLLSLRSAALPAPPPPPPSAAHQMMLRSTPSAASLPEEAGGACEPTADGALCSGSVCPYRTSTITVSTPTMGNVTFTSRRCAKPGQPCAAGEGAVCQQQTQTIDVGGWPVELDTACVCAERRSGAGPADGDSQSLTTPRHRRRRRSARRRLH
ncbi:hypothetical protein FJT64_020428 [Amphibalanus amphitrite]|uniref:Uncharacterized protein n=1 Tax=Amphibalanus amphitrite TaxID=1232801 RepID=A0A6A4WLL3_AMPAM|nr:hypothetical protein FJT64_020428 [Amphibalanus amphitrite]